MDTYFAPAERAGDDELHKHIKLANNNLIINGMLKSVSGLLAILNEQRQIIAVNEALIKHLGVQDEFDLLGLRPGEAFNCVHSTDMPGGCGTSKYCATCGAALAIVTALEKDKCDERKCITTTNKDGRLVDICLRVRACTITHQDERFVVLFLQDMTKEERRVELERTFFHDLMNVVNGLVNASDLLIDEEGCGDPELLSYINQLSSQLETEVNIQRSLVNSETFQYTPQIEDVSVADLLEQIRVFFSNHPTVTGKKLRITPPEESIDLRTDQTLARRILINMLTNALEASTKGETVKLWIDIKNDEITFCVWNRAAMPEDVAVRVFQRHFTTKGGLGRGIGTFSMKHFGEYVLGGNVTFTTSEDEGTVFRFTLPR